ncbi:glycoside hydrolase family 15 [Georgenia sp. TF02-10]|uniref:glycoside hydrolase family 15 protein n=1 Tax=Georgenia sp. TF02-10 TaxID=2917725 RepID=UPI001FA7A892|nr:glycoside hydrolase family 15 protein [Georgenia sp. TF02-10]UNX55298.1 glycoside hydrolase family 15 [Georgenia sp. TF02-10]
MTTDAPPRPPGPARAQASSAGPGTGRRARRRSRRWLAVGLAVVLYLATAAWSVYLKATESTTEFIDLYLDGVHLQADGTVADVPARQPVEYLPGSRVLAADGDDPAAVARAEEQRDWLAAGTVPGAGGPYEDLVTGALLDIRTLTGATFDDGGTAQRAAPGAVVAGWTDRWRYVWPRDASFVAAALARTGHAADAVDVLAFVGRAQSEAGGFQARYLPDASGVPDGRGVQLDGTGWVLWSAGTVLAEVPADQRPAVLAELRPLVDRATDQVLALTADAPHLPPPSADYWEVREDELTLGTVAPMLAGLEHAARIYDDAGLPDRARDAAARAEQVRAAVVETFGADGYTRYAGDGGPMTALLGADGRDAATAMLLPPFTDGLPGAEEAWLASAAEMARPAGGLAPGAGWKRDGVSWTPETTLYALTAASTGHHDQARAWLDWVAAHRTASGAIPEKVLAGGAPAAVAPLTWSSANVVLAVAALEDAGAPGNAGGR